eukprot:gene13338-4186_t
MATTTFVLAYPSFFRDLDKIKEMEQVRVGHYNDEHESFKDYVIESSKAGKGTLIMRADEWKREWCKAKAFNQTIRQQGCFSRQIQNRYCYGQCNSIYIPGQQFLEGCSSCRPKSYQWMTVTLLCPFSSKKRQHKQVQKIYSCYCNNCPK